MKPFGQESLSAQHAGLLHTSALPAQVHKLAHVETSPPACQTHHARPAAWPSWPAGPTARARGGASPPCH
jgi:hypothetical protein